MTDQPAEQGQPSRPGRPGARGGRDQVVADLDAELRTTRAALTERLDRLEGDLVATRDTTASTTGQLAEALPRLEDLFGEVAELRGRLDQLAATDPPEVKTPPVCWPALEVDEAATAWDALARWIADVLGPWYQPTRAQLPDCWALHRPAVLELSWLHTTWTDAHQPKARPAAAAEWHARWRPAALGAVATAIPTQHCRAASDRPGDHLVPQLGAAGTRPSGAAPSGHPFGPPPGTTSPSAASPSATGPSATAPPAARDFTDPADQTTTPRFWGHYFEQAKAADLSWRRRRVAV